MRLHAILNYSYAILVTTPETVLAACIPLFSRFAIPSDSFLKIFGYSPSVFVMKAGFVLRIGIALKCRFTRLVCMPSNALFIFTFPFAPPLLSFFRMVVGARTPIVITFEAPFTKALFSRFLIPFYRFAHVFWHALTFGVALSKIILSASIALVRSFAKPVNRFGEVFGRDLPIGVT